jgi:hypothetical protein
MVKLFVPKIITDECILGFNVAYTMTTGSYNAIFKNIYAKFNEIDLKMCVARYQVRKNQHFYVGSSHGKIICAQIIIDECILGFNAAYTMTTGSYDASFINIYAKFNEIDLKMCVARYQIRKKSAFLCRIFTR